MGRKTLDISTLGEIERKLSCMYGNPVWDNKTVYTVGDEVNCIYTVWMNEFNG